MAKSHTDDEILTAAQIATEWHVSIRTVQRYVQTGRLKATRLPGGQFRIRRTDAESALSQAAAIA